MDISIINEYLVVSVVLLCLCIGYIIKHLVPGERVNKFIPLIVGLLGVFFNIWMNGWQISPDILLGGAASGLASTGMHQIFKAFIERE